MCNTIIIDFCLHFSLGDSRITSESTKQLLRDSERITGWFDDYYDDYFSDYYSDYYDDDDYF